MVRISIARKIMSAVDDSVIERGRRDSIEVLKRVIEEGGSRLRWLVDYGFPGDVSRALFHKMLKRFEREGLTYTRGMRSVAVFRSKIEAEIFRDLVHRYGGKARMWVAVEID
ncbi:MAG: hypothetical protein ACXQTI_01310 [Candidatus Nezhaarchaeales archaeon]